MRNVKKITALASGTLAALLLASPIAAQTNQSAPGAYGNSGSTAAGPGTGASTAFTNRGTGGGTSGSWGWVGLIGLLGLFGVNRARRSTTRDDLPRSSVPPSPPR